MNIQTLEERLQKKAEKIGKDRAQKRLSGLPHPSDLKKALNEIKDSFTQGSAKDVLREHLMKECWIVQIILIEALEYHHTAEALEELRTELLELSDRLEELTQE